MRGYHFSSAALPSGAGSPTWLAYDHGVGSYYVAENPSIVVAIPAGSFTVAATIGVGTSPFGVAYDPADARLFVANTGSGNVTVISDATNTTIGSVPVGLDPYGVAYDNRTNSIFVANGGSNTVSVINGSTLRVVTNVSVGTGPVGLAYDPVSDDVIVANNLSNNVSVIAASSYTVVATVAAGDGPYAVAVDNATGNVFVSNTGSGNITVIAPRGNATLATIGVGSSPEGMAYDAATRTLWVAQWIDTVTLVSSVTFRVVQVLLFDPAGAVYNPDDKEVCVTNAANATFQCLVGGRYSDVTNVTVNATGLPSGTRWGVTITGGLLRSGFDTSSNTSSLQLQLYSLPGWDLPYDYSVDPVSQFAASPPSGEFYANLTTANLTIPFVPDSGAYVVTFLESGLSLPGVTWGVQINGTNHSYSSSLGSLGILVRNGSYRYAAFNSEGATDPPNASFQVAGADVNLTLNFTAAVYLVQFDETGLPPGLTWAVVFAGSQGRLTTDGGTDTFLFPPVVDGTYAYGLEALPNWDPSNVAATGTITVQGRPVTLSVTYTARPATEYPVDFEQTGLPTGALWSVRLGGTTESSTSAGIGFHEPNGSYAFQVDVVSGYSATPQSGSVVVQGHGNTTSVHFLTGGATLYVVAFTETGLPNGTVWTVAVDGLSQTSNSMAIAFEEQDGSHVFLVQNASGRVPAPATGTLTVRSAAQMVAITFAPFGGSGSLVEFEETGAPMGSPWTVMLNGVVHTSSTATLTLQLPDGTYTFLAFAGLTEPAGGPSAAGSFGLNGTTVVVPLDLSARSSSNNGLAPSGWDALTTGATPLVLVGVVAALLVAVFALVLALRERRPPATR